MIITFETPVKSMAGTIGKDFYVRRYRNKYIVQRKPDRSKQTYSAKQRKAQREFARKYYGNWKKRMEEEGGVVTGK